MPSFVTHPVVVRAPASSANLGPGFDSLGLALSLIDHARVRVTTGGLDIAIDGEGESELPRDERHLTVRAMRAAFDRLGGQPPGLQLSSTNRIPHGRGLGSSAAAIVTGILAARALTHDGEQLLDDAGVLGLAAGLEGHADNVAACLRGGLVITWGEGDETQATSCPLVPGIGAALYIPEECSSTSAARALLPTQVPHPVAAANAGRAALLIHGLGCDPTVLFPATRDWLHQDVRAATSPASAALIAQLREIGVAAVLSGAGPSVLALLPPGVDVPAARPGFALRRLSVALHGATAIAV